MLLDFVDTATRLGLAGKPSSEADLEGGGVGRAVDRRSRFFGRRRDGSLVCAPQARSIRERITG